MADEAETHSHFEYAAGPGERLAFAHGRASRDAEVAALTRQLAEAQGVIERQAKVLRIIEEILLPAEQTNLLSGSGREIMRMVREVLSERDKHPAAMGTKP